MPGRPYDTWCRGLTGKTVGKFTLTGFLGAGHIGYVYRAQHRDFRDSVRAIKLIFDTLRDGWDVELKKVVRLELTDGVVHYHDHGAEQITHEGTSRLCQYTVWDYIHPGENLAAYLKRVGRLPVSFLIALVERVLHVLHACVAQGVARHGDLHSGNILIGGETLAKLDDSLQPRAPIYVSDFGYGATGRAKAPKDDYAGLRQIINEMIPCVDYSTATATHRQVLRALQQGFSKLLLERSGAERKSPLDLLRALADIKRNAQAAERPLVPFESASQAHSTLAAPTEVPSVGQFQVSEMIGDRWDWWRHLFVPTAPARSKILALDIPTVVTGPRGCGKTMLLRRLSERLVVECGAVDGLPTTESFVAFYVNANDFADAFAHFPEQPTPDDEARLICYANLCILGDLLTVQSARCGRLSEASPPALLSLVHQWLIQQADPTLVIGEDPLERYRAILEEIKWTFPGAGTAHHFLSYSDFSQHRWLPRLVQAARTSCPWIGSRPVLLFIDDFSTPRISYSMQRVLNRLFFQRSPDFLAKLATEAWSTFIPEDSSGKNLQDGDDYQLVDMGEESLFLPDAERLAFLSAVFSRRLARDPRMPSRPVSLNSLLGRMGLSKTEFARRLRQPPSAQAESDLPASGSTQRRGRSRARVEYFGEDVFSDLWSGDTRTMIQLISDVVDQASETSGHPGTTNTIDLPVSSALQDRVFRNRGGEWLNSHIRNEPTDPDKVRNELERIRRIQPAYSLVGGYGDHLKAIVEAFVVAAKELLLGPTYAIREGGTLREVPRMAFRLEILDEFRVDGLAAEIYRDLIRYGLFLRDSRGKSVRGAFVPRLYLRRLLLPYCALALSKRDSVPLTCEDFVELLLQPDRFGARFAVRRTTSRAHPDQLNMFGPVDEARWADSAYDDLGDPRVSGRSSQNDAGPFKTD